MQRKVCSTSMCVFIFWSPDYLNPEQRPRLSRGDPPFAQNARSSGWVGGEHWDATAISTVTTVGLSFLEFCHHLPQPLACPTFSINLPSHFVTIVYFSKSTVCLCAGSRGIVALSGEVWVSLDLLIAEAGAPDGRPLCEETLQHGIALKNGLPPEGIRQVNKSQTQL